MYSRVIMDLDTITIKCHHILYVIKETARIIVKTIVLVLFTKQIQALSIKILSSYQTFVRFELDYKTF